MLGAGKDKASFVCEPDEGAQLDTRTGSAGLWPALSVAPPGWPIPSGGAGR